jgi:arylsulfatase A-like enzyme
MAKLGLEFSVSDTMTGWLDRDANFDLAILPYYGWDQSLHMLYQEYVTWRDPVRIKGTPADALDRVTTGGEIAMEAARVADRLVQRGLKYAGPDGYVVVWSDHGHRAAEPCRRRIAYRRSALEGRDGRRDARTIEAGELKVNGARLTLAPREVTWYGRTPGLTCVLKFPVIEVAGDQAETHLARLEALALASGEPMFHRVGTSLRPTQALQTLGAGILAKENNDLFSVFVNSGSHGQEDDGIFAVVGPGVRAGKLSVEVRSVDTTPTVLWLMGLPSAEDLDGRPITEILTPAERERRPVTWVPTFEDGVRPWATPQRGDLTDDEAERLKALGYLE